MLSSPIDLQGWIEENRFNLLPPVNNGIIHQGKDFFVMAISGPNVRTDYHINPYEVRCFFWETEEHISVLANIVNRKKPI